MGAPDVQPYNLLHAGFRLPVRSPVPKHRAGPVGRSRRIAPAASGSAEPGSAGEECAATGLARSEFSRIPQLAAPGRSAGLKQHTGVSSPSLWPPWRTFDRTRSATPEPAQSRGLRLSPRARRSSADPSGFGRSDGVGVSGPARPEDRYRGETLLQQLSGAPSRTR